MYIHLISLFIKFQTIYPDKYTTTVNYSTDIFIDFFKGVNLTNILTFRIRNIKRSIAITFNVSVSISILRYFRYFVLLKIIVAQHCCTNIT